MKKISFVVLLLLFSFTGYSQEETPVPEQKVETLNYSQEAFDYYGIDVPPQFPGGIKEFYGYIAKNYKAPDTEKVHGKILVNFIIEKDGSITDVKVIKDIGYGTGKEAVRVLKNSPKWSPGEQNGKKVRVLFTLPIQL